MRFRQLSFLLFIFILNLCFQTRNSAAQTTIPISDEKKSPVLEEDLVHFGDVVDVDVLGSYEYDWRGNLTPEGYLNGLDYAENPVYGLCRSESEIARAVEAGYSKILKNPQVVVKIIDRSKRPVTELSGAVKISQRFQIRRPVFLNELLVLSGGMTEKASGEVQILRPANLHCTDRTESAKNVNAKNAPTSGETQIIKIEVADLLAGKKEANPKIFNGDLIIVSVAEPIYLIGGVQNPKQIQMRSRMTLTRAIDSAGGISKSGREQEITIFRRENGATKIIETDLSKIKNHQADDLVLMANDIIEVGQKGGGKRKYPPVIREGDGKKQNISAMPLVIIE